MFWIVFATVDRGRVCIYESELRYCTTMYLLMLLLPNKYRPVNSTFSLAKNTPQLPVEETLQL